MTKALFYIIIISQIWLGIGSTVVHLISQDCELIELIGEEEKEIEKEIEKFHESVKNDDYSFFESLNFSSKLKASDFIGREHLENTTPPPELLSIFS